jgi:hypothetical protein
MIAAMPGKNMTGDILYNMRKNTATPETVGIRAINRTRRTGWQFSNTIAFRVPI